MKSSSSFYSLALFWTAASQSGVLVARAQELTFDFANRHLRSASLDGIPVRDLQSSSNPCRLEGPYLVCDYGYEIQGQTYDEGSDTILPTLTSVAFQAKCVADANIGFDYRRSASCSCQATVTKTDLATENVLSQQYCPCQVCAAELGDSPIHINCTEAQDVATQSAEEPSTTGSQFGGATTATATTTATTSASFIVQNCTSVDCFGYCNSTCSLNCDNTTGIPPCDFCTATDTEGEITIGDGEGKQDIGAFGEETSGAVTTRTVGSVLSLLLAALLTQLV